MKKLTSETWLISSIFGTGEKEFSPPNIAALRFILFLIILWSGFSTKTVGQHLKVTGDKVHILKTPGKVTDLSILDNPLIHEISFMLTGGDGGAAAVRGPGISHAVPGGQGARTQVVFRVGPGEDQLPHGSTLRFVVGAKGDSGSLNVSSDNDGTAYGGGGGGSGILIKKPGSDTWELLAVAGGGGGGFLSITDGVPGSGNAGGGGQSGEIGGGGTGENAGTGGNDGQGGDSFAGLAGAGGGIYSNGAGFICPVPADGIKTGQRGKGGGGKGGTSIGTGGSDIKCISSTTVKGGQGFGGGGAGFESGGGGGGFSGGGAGGSAGSGGGGGSYVNDLFASLSEITEGKTTKIPGNGSIWYKINLNQLPEVRCQSKTLYLDADGVATLTAEEIDGGSTDPDGTIADLRISQSHFTCADAGDNTITLEVTDDRGAKNVCTATVTVSDTVSPAFDPVNITIYTDALGQAVITAEDVIENAYDACGIASSEISQTDFDCSNLGENTITISLKDENNNVTTKTAIVTVTDTVPPVFNTVNAEIYLDGAGQAVITADDVIENTYDACGITSSEISQTDFDCSNLGENTITISLKDENNNVTTKTAIVTVFSDPVPEVRTRDITVYLDRWGEAGIDSDMIDGGNILNCGIISTEIEGQTRFGCDDVGEHQLTLKATTENAATISNSATITVRRYEPDFSNVHGISDGDTIMWESCQSPLEFTITDLEDYKNLNTYGNIISSRSKISLPEKAPWGAYEMWQYVCEYSDACGKRGSMRFYLILFDTDPPQINIPRSDITISSAAELPEPDRDVEIVDFCQTVVWDTVTTTAVINPNTGDTLGFIRRWIAEDPSGHRSFKDQMIRIGTDHEKYHSSITGRIASEDQLLNFRFRGEPGLNGISADLYRLDTAASTRSRTDTWVTGDWGGAQGTYYFGITQPGVYQVKIDSPLCFTDGFTFDNEGWSDTIILETDRAVNLGMALTEDCKSESENNKMAPDVAEIHRFPPSEQTRKNNDESWSIYPNPASGQIMLEINTDRVLDFHLYDALGRYMKSGNYVRGESLDVGDMRAGVYYLQLNEGEKQRGTKRLIILE